MISMGDLDLLHLPKRQMPEELLMHVGPSF